MTTRAASPAVAFVVAASALLAGSPARAQSAPGQMHWRATFLSPRSTPAASVVAESTSTAAAGARHVSLVMQSLYVTTVVVQGLDAYSTFKALDKGAVEANGLIEPLARRRPAFVAFKAGVAAAIIYGGHQLSRRHKPLAIVVLAGVNGAYLAIVIHNLHVAARAPAAAAIWPGDQ